VKTIKNNGIENFGNLAITVPVTHSFASCPHEQFAFIGFQRNGEEPDTNHTHNKKCCQDEAGRV